MIVSVYTDASHSDVNRIASCGFVVIIDGKIVKHEVVLLGNIKSIYVAEFTAAINALQYCFLLDGVKRIVLNTDCLGIVNCSHMRPKKHRLKFIAELIDTIEIIREYGVELDIEHVEAHGSSKMNNFIDRSCRKFLRLYIKTKRNETHLSIDRFFSYNFDFSM